MAETEVETVGNGPSGKSLFIRRYGCLMPWLWGLDRIMATTRRWRVMKFVETQHASTRSAVPIESTWSKLKGLRKRSVGWSCQCS